ncbi:glycine receptor subunit alpha-2-like [Ixodes scapularis]|uniref:glycine receptor subunit alpha-2-like n=1 Tax=Ixodes scapularis TaxID=6945 RepID=UPI001AD69E0A|nr:glycine receptor subunit alpha-2-like [Ixodes scapularis]
MNFQLFPMDRQKCNIFIRPYAHTDDKVQLFWRDKEPALLQFSNDMPEFDLIDFYSGSFTRYHHTGNFSSLNLVFLLERDPGYYLIHMYLPLTLTVLMSWHALWFKVEIPQARMVLSVNCLFTAVTVANDARSSIPRVSYLKMADVWITACILFIYGLILVSSMVNFMSRMKLRPVIMRKVDQGLGDMWHVWKHGTPSDDFLLKLDKANKLEHHRNLKRSESVERNARYLFPICFIFFNIVYWPFYVRRTYETL